MGYFNSRALKSATILNNKPSLMQCFYLLGEGNGLLNISHTLIFIKNEVPPWCTGLADEKCGGIYHCKDTTFF